MGPPVIVLEFCFLFLVHDCFVHFFPLLSVCWFFLFFRYWIYYDMLSSQFSILRVNTFPIVEPPTLFPSFLPLFLISHIFCILFGEFYSSSVSALNFIHPQFFQVSLLVWSVRLGPIQYFIMLWFGIRGCIRVWCCVSGFVFGAVAYGLVLLLVDALGFGAVGDCWVAGCALLCIRACL